MHVQTIPQFVLAVHLQKFQRYSILQLLHEQHSLQNTTVVFKIYKTEALTGLNYVCPYSSTLKFSDFVQNLLPKEENIVNIKGNIFDYFLDMKTLQLVLWKQRRQERTEQGIGSTCYIQLPEVHVYHGRLYTVICTYKLFVKISYDTHPI